MDVSNKEWANEVARQIHDNYTSNDESYYNATFYQEEDHGTAHVSVLAPNGWKKESLDLILLNYFFLSGDAVAITSTINTHFGSEVMSRSTGVK